MEEGISFASLAGSVSTPYFKNIFDENKFENEFLWYLTILFPSNITEGSNLVLDIEYDMSAILGDKMVLIYGGKVQYLEGMTGTARRTFLATEGKELVL